MQVHNLSFKREANPGNLTGRSDSGLTLTYDALNRLTATSQAGQPSQSYSYDDQGRRTSKTIGTTTTNFLYNGPDIQAEYGATWGSPTAQYIHGPRLDDETIRIAATGAQYFHQDGLNSVVGVTNSLGGVDATQRFDAWGNKLAATGTAPRYGYTGREPDETGLVYYRARYYDPALGRFTQRDPIGLLGGVNRYAYVGDDPINTTDPSGRFAWVGFGIGLVTGGVAGYVSGGWQGAMIGGVVGAIVGVAAPGAAAQVGAWAGNPGTWANMMAGTLSYSAIGGASGAGATMTTNLWKDKPITDDLGWGISVGLLAPLASAEAFWVGVGGAEALGTGVAFDSAFSGATGITAIIGALIDPNSDHTVSQQNQATTNQPSQSMTNQVNQSTTKSSSSVVTGKGGYTVGGLPGKIVTPVAQYAGNQKK